MYICKVNQKKSGDSYVHDSILLEFDSMVNIEIFLDSMEAKYPDGYEFSAEIETKKEGE